MQVLLRSPGVRVMSFSQADRRTRGASPSSPGSYRRVALSIWYATRPPPDTVLLATTANVLVRDDLHLVLASLLMQAMAEVHGKSGFFQHAGEFPVVQGSKLCSFGRSRALLQVRRAVPARYLPFWIAVLVERLIVLIVPIIVLLLPLLKVALLDLHLAGTFKDIPLLWRFEVHGERAASELRPIPSRRVSGASRSH